MSPAPYPSPQNPFQGPTGSFVNGFFVPPPSVAAATDGSASSNPPSDRDGSETPEWYDEPASHSRLNLSTARTGAPYPAMQQSGSSCGAVDGGSKRSMGTSSKGRGASLAARVERCVRSGIEPLRTRVRNLQDGMRRSLSRMWSLKGESLNSSEWRETPPSSWGRVSTDYQDREDGEVDSTPTTKHATQAELPAPRVADEPPRLTVPYSVSLGAEISAMFTSWCELVDESGPGSSSPGYGEPLLGSQATPAPPSPRLEGNVERQEEDADPYAWLDLPPTPKLEGNSGIEEEETDPYAWLDLPPTPKLEGRSKCASKKKDDEYLHAWLERQREEMMRSK